MLRFSGAAGKPNPIREKATEMPALKKDDELIIDDELTRQLLTALLAKWGDPDAEFFVVWAKKHMDDRISLGDARLISKYPRNIYNKATGRKTAETFREAVIAHNNLLNEAKINFQSRINEAISIALLTALREVANLSADAPINRIRDEAETDKRRENTKWNRTTKRHLREALGTARPLGKPTKYTKEQIEKRSLAIIRAINAGARDKGKVALLFYSDFDESATNNRSKLLNQYSNCSSEKRKAYLRRYHELLRGKFTFEELLTKVQKNQRIEK